MNIGVVDLADTESIEIVIRGVVKGHLADHCRPDYKDVGV